MKTVRIGAALVVGAAVAAIVGGVVAEHQHPEGWTLPFNTNDKNWNDQSYEIHLFGAPGLANHTGPVYRWAVDYSPAPNTAGFPIRAPRDGTVWATADCPDDTCEGGLRLAIEYETRYSRYSHLDRQRGVPAVGTQVSQGDIVAWSGISGSIGIEGGYHLHYEVRQDMINQNIDSGTSIPMVSIPGHWWYPCYSPPPGTPASCGEDVSQGVAQHPVQTSPPSWAEQSTRHLANFLSPPGHPSLYTSSISDSSATLHRGGNPSTPGTNDAAWFQTWKQQGGVWSVVEDWVLGSPTFTAGVSSVNQSWSPNNHYFAVDNWSQNSGYSAFSYVTLAPSNSASNKPHIAAWTGPQHPEAVLEYEADGATFYEVQQWRDSSWQTFYRGEASQWHVPTGYWYRAYAWYPGSGWSSYAGWLWAANP